MAKNDRVKSINYTEESNPDVLAVVNDLAEAMDRKPHDALAKFLLEEAPKKIAELKAQGQEKSNG